MSELAPSILSADFNRLGSQIKILEQSNVRILHVDVMDGMFVPSISFGMPVIASIRKESSLFFDLHLMVQEPLRYIEEFVKAGADSITVHVEACKDMKETLAAIRRAKVRCAISVNPETPVSAVLPYLELVDMVLVMGVCPGFGGQKLIPETLDKIKELVVLRQEKGLGFSIEIDGGVNTENIGEIASIGADIIVAGTAVFSGEIAENVCSLREVIADAS